MIPLLHNDLLVQQIGWTLLHTLWQGMAIALLLAIVLRAMRNTSSNARYIVACGAMSLMLASAIVTFTLLAQSPITATLRVARIPQPINTPAQTNAIIAPAHPTAPTQPATSALRCIVTIWIAGVVAIALWHVGGWLLLVRLRRGEPVERLRDVLDRLAKQIGVTRTVRVLQAARIDVPAVIGVLRPVILVPVALLNDLSPQQVEAILAHELAHIRRHDFLLNLIQSAVETLLFYHPATWWISATIRRERENCCDDIAANICGDDRAYAAALAALEMRRPTDASLHLSPSATGGDLLDRVRRILKLPPLRRRISRTRSLAAAALALACVVLPMVVTAAAADEKPSPAQQTTPTTSPYRFIKIVVGKDELRHDGKFIDIAALKKLLSVMPEAERRKTVLEVAAATPDVTVERFFTATAALHRIVEEQKLAYLSEAGIQATTAPTTRAAGAADIIPADADAKPVGEYYISGHVRRVGVYSLTGRKITLKQAVAAAGGFDDGKTDGLLTIIRRSHDRESKPVENVRFSDLLSGAQRDAYLQANDVIQVTPVPAHAPVAPARAPVPATQPHAAASSNTQLQAMLVQRSNLAREMTTISTKLGSEHPTMKALQAQIEHVDAAIAERGAAVATAPVEEIAAVDPQMARYVNQLAEMEFNFERIKSTMGAKSRVYLDAERDIELQRRRIETYAKAWRDHAARQTPVSSPPTATTGG